MQERSKLEVKNNKINFKTKLYKTKGKGKMDKAENSPVVKKNCYLPRNLI